MGWLPPPPLPRPMRKYWKRPAHEPEISNNKQKEKCYFSMGQKSTFPQDVRLCQLKQHDRFCREKSQTFFIIWHFFGGEIERYPFRHVDIRTTQFQAIFSSRTMCIASSCTWLYRLPQSQKQCIYLSKVYCYLCGKRKFLAVRQVGLMTHRENRIDRPFPVT